MARGKKTKQKKRTEALYDRAVCMMKNGQVISGYPYYAEYCIEEKMGSWLVYTEERGERHSMGIFRSEEEAKAFVRKKLESRR